jgi:uncharacterized membrane protein YagU involved in acid resistance
MRKLWAIILGGAAAGFLDHMSALATFLPQGASAMGLHQYLASGVLGQAAFAGGWATAVLGVCVHFTLTTLMAGLFVAASQRFPVLLRHSWPAGLSYGVLIYFFMNYIAVPLSAAPNWKPGHGWAMVSGLLGHAMYVGVPIAAIARALLLDLPAAAPAVEDQQQLSPRRI